MIFNKTSTKIFLTCLVAAHCSRFKRCFLLLLFWLKSLRNPELCVSQREKFLLCCINMFGNERLQLWISKDPIKFLNITMKTCFKVVFRADKGLSRASKDTFTSSALCSLHSCCLVIRSLQVLVPFTLHDWRVGHPLGHNLTVTRSPNWSPNRDKTCAGTGA